MSETELKSAIEKSSKELFSEIYEEIISDSITDLEWDGYNLWITEIGKGSYISKKELSESYLDNLSIKLANIMGVQFNRTKPILEANTDSLRISIWHESRCGKKSVAIRKIPRNLRFDRQQLVDSSYAPQDLIILIENCVVAHFNCIIGGQPHAGKTELLKYLATFIPAYEKVGCFEDNQEIHYRSINPNKKCVEFYVDDKVSYPDIIRAGLRHNIDWILLSEARGVEILDLLNSLSTGAFCMTTIHLDDVKALPDRMYNMLGSSQVSDRFINSIYKYIDVCIMVECDKHERRRITQVAFYTRQDGENKCYVIYEDGSYTGEKIPNEIMRMFKKYGITNPFNKLVNKY